jgi:hypothetical protein
MSKQQTKLTLKYYNETEYPEMNYERFPNINFNEYSWCVGRVVPCGRREITKLIGAYRIF